MSWLDSLLGDLNSAANSINPFKGATDWLTDNTLAKLPVVGKPLGQLADWGDSHPAQVGAAIGAAFGGAALLGGAGGGAAAGGAAGGEAAAGGAAAGGADVAGLAAADSAAVGAEGAVPGLTEGYGAASSSSALDWQSLLKNQASNALSSSSGSGSTGGGSMGGSQSSSPDFFNSLFSFGPGSVAPTPAAPPPTDYSALLLNGLGLS